MPRAYTALEQDAIRDRLMTSGRSRFEQVGLHKVTIAELTRAAGIGKGSFYLFFSSKEALFFAIQEQLEREFKARLERELATHEHDPYALIERFVTSQLHALSAHPFLRHLVDPGVIEALRAKLPPAVLAAHEAADKAFYLRMVRGWIERGVLPPSTDPELIFSVLAASFALSLNRALVGDRWQDVVGLLARALARELTSG